ATTLGPLPPISASRRRRLRRARCSDGHHAGDIKTLPRYVLLALLGGVAPGRGANSEPYPTRPVSFVVPFAPGGGTEFLARMLGQRLEQRLGKTFGIEKRAGGGGGVGGVFAAPAAPDGYTILMAPSPVMAINLA